MARLRILHVDDDPYVRRAVARTLSTAGMIVASAASSAQAELALHRSIRFDLAIVDREIGSEDGLDLVRILRAEHPRMVVLLMSGSLTDDVVTRAHELGVSRCIDKPCAADRLIEQIRFFAGGSGMMPMVSEDVDEAGSGTDG